MVTSHPKGYCVLLGHGRSGSHRLYRLILLVSMLSRASSWQAHRKFCWTMNLSFAPCRTTRRYLNRILFDPSEVDDTDGTRKAVLPKDDYRTIHASRILGLRNGDSIRAGIVSNGHFRESFTDKATVEWIPEGGVKKSEPLKNGNPPGSLSFNLIEMSEYDQDDDIPVSLILALPAPLRLGRILPMVSQMGVDHLVLANAAKVPKDYFGSHLFRKPASLTERLVEGLCQAGDVRMPKVHVTKNLSRFLNEEMDSLFPPHEVARVVAHPQRKDSSPVFRMNNVPFPPGAVTRRMVVAVGPEGGWEEPDELKFFQERGFHQVTLGKRTLRTDCAVVSLLCLAHEACECDAS